MPMRRRAASEGLHRISAGFYSERQVNFHDDEEGASMELDWGQVVWKVNLGQKLMG